VKIIVAFPLSITRNTIKSYFTDAGIAEVTEIGTLNEVAEQVAITKPDFLFIESYWHGNEKAGIEIIPEVKAVSPKTKIIVFDFLPSTFRSAALAAGADFVSNLDIPSKEILSFVTKNT